MQQDQELIAELGLQNLTPEHQQNVLNELRMQIGEALAAGVSQAQLNEYRAIIDGDQAVIDAWLEANYPNYKDEPAYQALAEGSDDVPADKMFAALAWVETNSHGLPETVARIKSEIAANLDAYKD